MSLMWEIPRGNSNQLGQRFDMLRGVSYVRIYQRPYAQKSRRRELPWSSHKYLDPCDMSHREVITSISDVFIAECIMLCEATLRMLDLKHAYCVHCPAMTSVQ